MNDKLNEIAWQMADCFETSNDRKMDSLWNKAEKLGFTYDEIAEALNKAIASRMSW